MTMIAILDTLALVKTESFTPTFQSLIPITYLQTSKPTTRNTRYKTAFSLNYSKRSSNLIFLNAPIIFIFTNSNTTVEFKFTNKCSAGKAWQTCYVYCDFSFWIMLTHRWFHKFLVTKDSQLLVLLISSVYRFP